MPNPGTAVRLDKWLWAARFFKTRALAVEAIEGGKVELNGEKPKRAKTVKPGDRLRLRLGPYEYLLTVRDVSERRGPATVAAGLYEEDPEGKARRELLREQHRLAPPAFDFGEGKPSKKQRRDLHRLKGWEDDE
jgi:ribosome-associated heat shock protein Hsp15